MRTPRRRQYAQKRTRRPILNLMATADIADEDGVKHSVSNVYAAVVNGDTTAAKFRDVSDRLNPAGATLHRVVCELAQEYALDYYRRELHRCQVSLRAAGAWEFLLENLQTAIDFGVEETFRHLVFQAAGTFADVRMLRVTRRYGPK